MSTFLIGDLHGFHDRYATLLQEAGLCDEELNWTGSSHTLWLIGDFFDRGKSGLKCIDITMMLQKQAKLVGGSVQALLGNHEMMILCAYRFKDDLENEGAEIVDQWLHWGGVRQDLDDFTEEHAVWIESLPVMARADHALLVHADAMLYINYGNSIEAVNAAFRKLIEGRELHQWKIALSSFGEHMAFSGLEITGKQRAQQFLQVYGGEVLIHGHTPIPYARKVDPESVTSAWSYAGGACINIDGGIYLGSPGFVYELTESEPDEI
jgi:hypothetical protein